MSKFYLFSKYDNQKDNFIYRWGVVKLVRKKSKKLEKTHSSK